MADSSLDIKMQDLKLSDSPVPALIPDRTPAETYTSMFEATTPPLEPSSPTETFGQDAEAEVEELLEYDTSSLKSADIKSDPILASLARKQSASRSGSQVDKARPESVGFKARPAPSSTRQDGRGPRMTKSAALRQGLDWAAVNSPTKKVEVSDHKESIHHVPGQRRDTPQAPVASLAAPSIAPRSTKSSTLRSGTGAISSPALPPKKDYAAQALLNKVKEKEERDRRRKSVALPASLSAPSIAPRQNKSSSLRTGAPVLAHSRTLTTSSIENVSQAKVEPKEKAGLSRRASIGVKSLGTPSIPPRLNRAALLRAPGSATLITNPTPTVKTAAAPPTAKTAPSVPRTPLSRTMSTNSSRPSTARPASVISPRPTKASLLRAGLGAQTLSRAV